MRTVPSTFQKVTKKPFVNHIDCSDEPPMTVDFKTKWETVCLNLNRVTHLRRS